MGKNSFKENAASKIACDPQLFGAPGDGAQRDRGARC